MPVAIGRYRVERQIGRGAMGVIYAAHDPVIDRKVAIKLIRADLLGGEDQADFVTRFQREARAAGRCVHPNIVAIYDFAVHEGNPFLAMEYVEARNLGQMLAQSGRFREQEAVDIVRQVLDALACAHAAGIVHRDVKPANILLLADGRVKMTDFGVARFDGAELSLDGTVIGTPSYMSPEQCRGDAVDARSDLFSVGVVLYEMLSGERPFPGRNFTEITWKLVHEPPPDIRMELEGISPGLAMVVERALAKQPADRFASAVDMVAALRDAPQTRRADDRTVVQHRPPEVAPRRAREGAAGRRLDTAAAVDDATLNTIERKLAQHVGPMAHHLVQNAARRAGSLDELCDTLGRLIERPEQRARFRQEILADHTQTRAAAAAPVAARVAVAAEEAQRAEQELVRYVGPIARILVKRAAGSAGSVDEFWASLATHISADADRQAFLRRRG